MKKDYNYPIYYPQWPYYYNTFYYPQAMNSFYTVSQEINDAKDSEDKVLDSNKAISYMKKKLVTKEEKEPIEKAPQSTPLNTNSLIKKKYKVFSIHSTKELETMKKHIVSKIPKDHLVIAKSFEEQKKEKRLPKMTVAVIKDEDGSGVKLIYSV